MRNLIAIVFVMAIATLFMAGAAGAQAQNCSEACTAIGDVGLTHGQCASLCQTCNCLSTNGNTCPVCECKFLELAGVLPPGFPLGQCINDARQSGLCVGNIAGFGCEF